MNSLHVRNMLMRHEIITLTSIEQSFCTLLSRTSGKFIHSFTYEHVVDLGTRRTSEMMDALP
jgi:hypothetical protein